MKEESRWKAFTDEELELVCADVSICKNTAIRSAEQVLRILEAEILSELIARRQAELNSRKEESE